MAGEYLSFLFLRRMLTAKTSRRRRKGSVARATVVPDRAVVR